MVARKNCSETIHTAESPAFAVIGRSTRCSSSALAVCPNVSATSQKLPRASRATFANHASDEIAAPAGAGAAFPVGCPVRGAGAIPRSLRRQLERPVVAAVDLGVADAVGGEDDHGEAGVDEG